MESRKRSKKINRVRTACVVCARSHASCDNARPCKRCCTKGLQHQCSDTIQRKRGRKAKYLHEEGPTKTIVKTNIEEITISPWPSMEPSSPLMDPDLFFEFESSSPVPALDVVELTLEQPSPLAFAEHTEKKLSCSELLKASCEGAECDKLAPQEATGDFKVGFNKSPIMERTWDPEKYQESIDKVVESAKDVLSKLITPSLILDRLNRIWYINDAFKQTTGLDFSVPTDPAVELFWKLFTLDGVKKLAATMINFFSRNAHDKTPQNGIMLNTELINFTTGVCIEGTLSMSYHPDEYGIPLVWTINFLPWVPVSRPTVI